MGTQLSLFITQLKNKKAHGKKVYKGGKLHSDKRRRIPMNRNHLRKFIGQSM